MLVDSRTACQKLAITDILNVNDKCIDMSKINRLVTKYLPMRIRALVCLVVLIVLSVSGPALGQSVLQGYASDEKLQRGMLVVGVDDDETKVKAMSAETAEKFKGVVAESNDSPVTISSEDRQIFVATTGPYQVLVTTENGQIKKGDYISISSSPGIGAKATEFQPYVIGVAAGDFEGGGDTIGSTSGGNVQLGRILVDVSFGRNPALKVPEKDRIPDALQKFVEDVADKPVSSTKLYIGFAILVAASVIAGSMLYSGVRSSVVSIGRNPLSKSSIYRGLIQVVVLSLIVFITGIFGVYLLIKL